MNKPIATTVATLLFCGFILLPDAANAYVGPGAGLSLLGALWALIIAVGTALIFIFAWPIRRMRRRKREAKEEREAEARAAQQRNAEDVEATTRANPVADNDADNDAATSRQDPAVELDDTERSRRQ